MMSFLDKLKNIDKKTKKIFRVSFIPMVLLALISCVIFSYMIVNAINAAVNTDVADTVQKVCDDINNAITQDVAVLNDVRLMSSENLSEKYITDMLYNVDENLTLSDSIYVVTTDFPKSGFFANNNGWIPEDSYAQHQRPWYEIPLKHDGKTAYIDPYIDEDTNQAVISITRAINSKGKTAGVAGIDIYLERLFKIFADLKISKSSKIYMLYIVKKHFDFRASQIIVCIISHINFVLFFCFYFSTVSIEDNKNGEKKEVEKITNFIRSIFFFGKKIIECLFIFL